MKVKGLYAIVMYCNLCLGCRLDCDFKQLFFKMLDGNTVKLSPELAKESEWITQRLKDRQGAQEEPINLPLKSDQLDFIKECLLALNEHRVNYLTYEKLGNLSLLELAQLIKDTWFLKVTELCTYAQRVFINKVKKDYLGRFLEDKNFIEQFKFAEPLQLSLTRLVLSEEDKVYVRSLLFKDIETLERVSHSNKPVRLLVADDYFVVNQGQYAFLWKLRTGQKITRFERANSAFDEVSHSCFAYKGSLLVTLSKEKVCVFDLIDKKLKFQLDAKNIAGSSEGFWGMSVNQDSHKIALGLGQSIVIWDIPR